MGGNRTDDPPSSNSDALITTDLLETMARSVEI